jgi:hypothetical protein
MLAQAPIRTATLSAEMQAAVNRTWHRLRGSGTLVVCVLAVVGAAILFAEYVNPRNGLYIWGVLIAGVVVYRWPAAAILVAFTMSGSYGSLKAFLNLPANGIATAVLVGAVVASLGAVLFGRRRYVKVLWPGAVAVALYVIAVFASLPFAPEFSPALKVARTEGLYILGFLLVAYGPWREGMHGRLRQGVVWVALGVGAYATLRYAIGASAKERAQVTAVAFNQTSVGHNKVQGSFPSGVELGLWTSAVIPFLVGTVLSARGRIRIVALAALPLCAIGLFGSGLRSGLVATVIALVVLLIVYAFALSMPSNRPLLLGVVVVGLVVGGVVLFPQIVGNNANSVQRYRDLLNPAHDASFRVRLQKWDQAFTALAGHTFGYGLGTIGPEAASQPVVRDINPFLDSSFVRIAYEQGVGVMVLFIIALALLLAGLIRRAVVSLDRDRAGPAIAATGTLVSAIVMMITEMYLTAPCALAIWVILGLGVAPFASRRNDAQPSSARSYARAVPAIMASSEYPAA